MSKRIIHKPEEKKSVYDGVNAVAKLAGSTMGASGKPVTISRFHGTLPIVTKDGVTVVADVMLKDELQNVGATFLKDAAGKTVELAGDGTTNTVVLANAIMNQGLKAINNGAKSQFVKQGIDLAIRAVVEELKNNSEQIGGDTKRILEVATISANNDAVIGKLIADVYENIGKDGRLTLEKSPTIETYTKVVDGFEFHRGYAHPYYINVPEKVQTVFDNPYIFVTDYEITRFKEIQPILEGCVQAGRPILIIATDVVGEAWGTLLQNKVQGNLKVCVVKAPNAYKKEHLADIAVLTGATVIRDDAAIKLTSAKMQHLGTCDKVIVTEKTTTIIAGHGEPNDILARKAELLATIESTESQEKKNIVEQRLAQLSGSVGVIYVGGLTDVEAKEKYDRVEDAVKAVKAAIQEGVSCGGGISLLRCISSISELRSNNSDIVSGFSVIKKSLEAPLRQMLRNAGIYHSFWSRVYINIFNIPEEEFLFRKLQKLSGDIGYNLKTGTIENLKENGVIDPTKVLRVSLEHAASVAGTLLSSDYFLIEFKD